MMNRKKCKHMILNLPRQDGSEEAKRAYNHFYYELVERFHPRRQLKNA